MVESPANMQAKGPAPRGAYHMKPQDEHIAATSKSAEEYRQTADAHLQELKGFWKRFLVSGLFVIAAVIIIFACLAWFVANNNVNATTSSLSAKATRYSLTVSSKVSGGETSHKGVYDAESGLTTADSMLVDSSSNFNNDTRAVLQPGSSGQLELMVTPYTDSLGNIQINLQRWLVDRSRNQLTADTPAESGDSNIEQLRVYQAFLSGHIMFFLNKDADGYYSSPVIGNSIEIDKAKFCGEGSQNTDKPYEFTLYWVWPEHFENFAITGTVNYTQNLFRESDATAAAGQENGYTQLLADANDSRAKYFSFANDSELPETIKEGMSTADLQLCANAYNKVDELLGLNVQYVQVRFDSYEQNVSAEGVGND